MTITSSKRPTAAAKLAPEQAPVVPQDEPATATTSDTEQAQPLDSLASASEQAQEAPPDPKQVLSTAIETLAQGRQLLTEIDRRLVAGAPEVYNAQLGFESAQTPLAEAMADTIETDVSFQGLAVKHAFAAVHRSLTPLDEHLAVVITDSAGFNVALESLDAPLRQVRQQLEDNPEALQFLDQALSELGQASRQNSETNYAGHRADNQCDYLLNATSYSIFADRISQDRIGRDVSFEANQLNSKVSGYLSFHLADADRRVQAAQLTNQQAGQDAHEAQTALQQTLALLDPTPESNMDLAAEPDNPELEGQAP